MREDDSFPITGRLLAAWPRFREATNDREDRSIVEWCRLTRLEVIALEKLRDQWREVGPIQDWFAGLDLLPGILGTLLEGFDWTVDREESIVRSFGAKNEGQQWALRKGLALERERREMNDGGVKTRMLAWIAEQGLDPVGAWPAGTRQALMAATGASKGYVAATLAGLRRAAGAGSGEEAPDVPLAAAVAVVTEEHLPRAGMILPAPPRPSPTPAPPANGTRTAPREPPAPALPPPPPEGATLWEIAETLAEVVIEHGSRSIEPPELREPVVALTKLLMRRKG